MVIWEHKENVENASRRQEVWTNGTEISGNSGKRERYHLFTENISPEWTLSFEF